MFSWGRGEIPFTKCEKENEKKRILRLCENLSTILVESIPNIEIIYFIVHSVCVRGVFTQLLSVNSPNSCPIHSSKTKENAD